ncbi:hypothetical protein Bmyc01_30130 [Bacillus mycoides]|uniref:Group-specific protein n=2 Tax=Bacillus cereus group TaxID=86661 RepID=A0AA44KVC8_9BACI|nr:MULTISPECIES: hypothetical protein [Bacillus]GLV64343.1 hypothetical protein Bmyc01_30130 [Bacillus mycoides]MBJ8105478.1 hypothetical protein [Bacillus cereus group sp. N8]MED1510852.1 hypothetical protein [Bacillus proteolyticus]OJD58156.1 hypothetical protein BAU27_17520 [Bacillus sp. NH11B]OJE44212.1 hypothetical protein BAQ49_09295 [Bacillus proteolyticus]
MRSRRYKRGDRVKININKSVSPEMIAWLNKQSNPTNFFFFAAQQLFKQVGDIDVSKTLPSSHVFSLYVEPSSLLKVEMNPFKNVPLETSKSTENVKKKSWESVDQLDCPFF